VKKEVPISLVYKEAVKKLNSVNTDPLITALINSSFCLIGSKSLQISIKNIGLSMVQLNIDKAYNQLRIEHNRDFLNYQNPKTKPFSILSPSYVTNLETNLKQMQLLIKFLLNDLIVDSKSSPFNKNEKFSKMFIYLSDLISKAIFFIKADKVQPEAVSEVIDGNVNAMNLLKSLGFSVQNAGVYKIRDESIKKVLIFPDNTYLDLNLRLTHVFSCLNELCFYYDESNISEVASSIHSSVQLNRNSHATKKSTLTTATLNVSNSNPSSMSDTSKSTATTRAKINSKIRSIVFNLEALLPVEDTTLLLALIDILALTKFSPEIVLCTTDHSIFYAFNFYEKFDNQSYKNKLDMADLMQQDLIKWNLSSRCSAENMNQRNSGGQLSFNTKYSINNKVVNFLLSIGFEIIGTWLRFADNEFNNNVLDLLLKFFTSFNLDRDMSLYKDLNINVLGQRSAQTRDKFVRTHSSKVRNGNDLVTQNKKEIKEEIDLYSVMRYIFKSEISFRGKNNNFLKNILEERKLIFSFKQVFVTKVLVISYLGRLTHLSNQNRKPKTQKVVFSKSPWLN
jgi:predicted nucleic-acid-binding protein